MLEMTFDQHIEVPTAAVYHALTNEAALTQWLCDSARVTVREGGQVYFSWNQPDYYAAGSFIELSPNERLVFSWLGKGEPAPTEVQIELSADGDGTTLVLTHAHVGEGEAWQETRDQIRRGWEYSLLNLKQVLETGLDKRVYDRPFLGVYIAGQVSAEEASEAGLPVPGGIRISGTVPGTGAEAAGLGERDVLTKIDDQEVGDFATLQKTLGGYKAGDTVSVVFYRGQQRHEAEMTFSSRPEPDVPAKPADLAERLRQVYRGLDEQLMQVVAGVDEEVAAYKPAVDRWSAKEILAHILTTERSLQMSIASNADGLVLRGWPNNPDAWMSAVASSYTLLEMVAALQKAETETVSLVAGLPSETVARKATYLALGENTLSIFPGHTRVHFGEMERVIEASRAALEKD